MNGNDKMVFIENHFWEIMNDYLYKCTGVEITINQDQADQVAETDEFKAYADTWTKG